MNTQKIEHNHIGKRIGIDFSNHIVLETHIKADGHNLDVWDLKHNEFGSMYRIRFINCCGTLTVNGDYGNWVFCREFHPSADNHVSDMYWSEKLKIGSKQTSAIYDPERTEDELKKYIKKGLQDYGYSGEELKQAKDFFKDLLLYVDDEIEYCYRAYRHHSKPNFLDNEMIPFCETRHVQLSVVYDAFDELCNRIKYSSEVKKN